MALTPKKLAQAEMTASNVTIYTVPGAIKTIIQTMDIANTSGGTIAVRVFFVPSGGTAGTTNAVIYDVDIPTKQVLPYTGPAILETGDFISVRASSATGATITISGIERT